jgi:Holliday junction resolvasome RuvABC ATP-dependent DNA helicase subunit
MTIDGMLDGAYPTDFDQFVGQILAIRQLKVSIASAKARGVRLPHILIASGEPGVGKTALGHLIAVGMGKHLHVVSGKMTYAQIRLKLSSEVLDGDILLYDEIHTVVKGGRGNADWMLHLLENGTLLGPMGVEEIPDITVVGTTTDVGKLPDTIRDRFPIQPIIVPYTAEEARDIAFTMGMKVFIGTGFKIPGSLTCERIAELATNNPRAIRSLLEGLRDLAVVSNGSNYDATTGDYNLDELLELTGMTTDGLDSLAQRYLLALFKNFSGNPAGESTIAETLNEAGGVKRVERVLMKRDLICKTKQGRMLTNSGIKRAKALAQIARDQAAVA